MKSPKKNPKSIIEQIATSDETLQGKIVLLFAVAMKNYGRPMGERAWVQMAKLAGEPQTRAIAQIGGFLMGPFQDRVVWKSLLPAQRINDQR